MSNIATEMIRSAIGRPPIYDFNLEVMERREYRSSHAQKVRSALSNYKKRNNPKWVYRTLIEDDLLIVQRIK